MANTIRYRRRKGTLALLELLANDVAGWPARAVEFFKLLGWNQNINHPHLDRARTVDLRQVEELDLIDGPFDRLAHTVDVRRINSHRTVGRYNIPSVGVFVWRLKSYSVTHSPAYCAEEAGPHCFTFSVLGQDAPLFIKPEPETEPTQIAEELNVPAPIRRLAFDKHRAAIYGAGQEPCDLGGRLGRLDPTEPIPVEAIIPADLSDWQYAPPLKHIAVDPVLGRFAFPPGQLPRKGVRVTYHYGFSADMGGGEYPRGVFDPSPRQVEVKDANDPAKTSQQTIQPSVYRVGAGQPYRQIRDALHQWSEDEPWDAVIELTDSGVYVEPIYIHLQEDRTLQLRAAVGAAPSSDCSTGRPICRMPSRLRWTRQPLHDGRSADHRPAGSHHRPEAREGRRSARGDLRIARRDSALHAGAGLGLDCDCEPKRPAEPSLELYSMRASVRIEHSIVGSIQIHEDEVKTDPIPMWISDSILDATHPQKRRSARRVSRSRTRRSRSNAAPCSESSTCTRSSSPRTASSTTA